jgi:hypothetical protein
MIGNEAVDPAHAAELRRCREIFQELVDAANALETVIERGYLDVESIWLSIHCSNRSAAISARTHQTDSAYPPYGPLCPCHV